MQFDFVFIGKTTEKYLSEGIAGYQKRLQHYIDNKQTIITADKLSAYIKSTDYIVVLDEHGKEYPSVKFAEALQKIMNQSYKKVVFIIGDAYGIDDQIKKRANLILSFSRFTFTHQMIRLLLLEQVYRAMTILKGEKYHHE